MKRSWIESSCLAIASFVSLPVLAADFSISGFGTLAYARSDQPYNYQRFINDRGTFKRDSVAGIQIDAKFPDHFGATMQIKEAPATDSDHGYESTVAWAFLSFRPSNDWLISAGKQRIPFYLYSQSYDVSVTYDFARLPTEMYSLSPSNDFNGLSLSKNWPLASGDLTVDGYWGRSKFDTRYWLRDGVPGVQSPGAVFRGVEFGGKMVVLSYKQGDDTYRIGVVRGIGRMQDGTPLPSSYPFVTVFPGFGYYQVNASMPGPGVGTKSGFHNTIVTLGADVRFDQGFRATAEFARTYITQSGVDFANASSRGYIGVLKKIEQWTPYVSYAFLHSETGQLSVYNKVNSNTVPNFVPGAVLINASQRVGADLMLPYDQRSWALGTSYSFSASSKLKAELMRTRIGQVSSLVDGPPGSNIRNQNINVFSVSYNFVF
jgi:hypothetical protein